MFLLESNSFIFSWITLIWWRLVLRLFKILVDEIIPVDKITPADVIVVFDDESKNLYLYRGIYTPKLDEFRAERLYERILNRFLNPNIIFIRSLMESQSDSEKIVQIKHYIFDHFINLNHYELKRSLENFFLLKDIRLRLKSFKNYEQSREWRTNLSNVTNLWRLSLFNILSIGSVFVILLLKTILDINRNDFIFINSDQTLDSTLWSLWLRELGLTFFI